MKNSEKLTQWAIDKIKTDYADDVALLIGHNTLKLEKDRGESDFSYFVPVDKIPYGFAKTFIIDGVGCDLFSRTWEQLGELASLTGYNISCLGDVEILYCRTEEDKQKFIGLQKQLKRNLEDKEYMHEKALEKLSAAMALYQNMLFEDNLSNTRANAGYIADFLSIAVAYENQTYFKHGQIDQIKVLKTLKSVPQGFIELYKSIVKQQTKEGLCKVCREIISVAKEFLEPSLNEPSTNENFEELAEWYHELSYTFRRIYHYSDENDTVNSFMWGCMMQSELNIVCEDFGLPIFDLLTCFDADDMTAYYNSAKDIENQIISIIQSKGIKLDSYNSVEEFISKNR